MVDTRPVNPKQGVTSDETIEFTSAKGRKHCPHRLRRIGYHDGETNKRYVFLTTHHRLSAKTIADIYKSRWQVELFFKWIKQNLKVMCMYLMVSCIKVFESCVVAFEHNSATPSTQSVRAAFARGVAGKRKRKPAGSFIADGDELHMELMAQQCTQGVL